MVESIPTQSAAGQAVFETAPASLRDAPSEVTAIEKSTIQENGQISVSETTGTNGNPAPLKTAATHGATEDDSSAPVVSSQDKSTATESAPLQTTTGEPNGTNGINANGVNGINGTALSKGEDDVSLFSPSLISPEVAALLPDGYAMRPLRRSDYNKGSAVPPAPVLGITR